MSDLLVYVASQDYRFVTPTPATHHRVAARRHGAIGKDLRDGFGWNLPFSDNLLPTPLRDRLIQAGWCVRDDGAIRSRVRISSIGNHLFLHSAYPTDDRDSVFLGPDSYRFSNFMRTELETRSNIRHLVDIGAGAGVGGIMAADLIPNARITLTDINPLALRLAAVNARFAGVEIETIAGSGLDEIVGAVDMVIANPPFIMDDGKRAYRDGGAMLGASLSLDWAKVALARLEPGGSMLLYTGSAIVDGNDALGAALQAEADKAGADLRYREIDPDIFGEELERPAYASVERIAAVGAVIRR